MSDPVATALTLAPLRAQRDEMKAVIEQASAALALAGFGGGLLAQVGAVLTDRERLNRNICAATSIGRKVLVALESDDEMLCEDRADAFQSACEQMLVMLSGQDSEEQP